MPSTTKRRRLVLHELEQAGLTVDRIKKGRHVKFYITTPSGPQILVTASTASDCRSMANTKARMAREN